MPMPVLRQAVIVSHQAGGRDGVASEVTKIADALGRLGIATRRVAGRYGQLEPRNERDFEIPPLWSERDDDVTPEPVGLRAQIAEALRGREGEGCDLVLFENVGTYPKAPLTATLLVEAARERGALLAFRHHDPPRGADAATFPDWPLHDQRDIHFAINKGITEYLYKRFGIDSTLLHNRYHIGGPVLSPQERLDYRSQIGIGPQDLLIVHPTLPYKHKDIPRATRFAVELARHSERRVLYWLTAPEADMVPILEGEIPGKADISQALRQPGLNVRLGHTDSLREALTAADLVILSSVFEGWGNGISEAAAVKTPIATSSYTTPIGDKNYPVMNEIRELGLWVGDIDDPKGIAALFTDSAARRRIVDANFAVMNERLNLAHLPDHIGEVFLNRGYTWPSNRSVSRSAIPRTGHVAPWVPEEFPGRGNNGLAPR